MKSRMLVAGMAIIALAALSGCAGGVNATKSIEFADANKTIAEEVKADASQMESANAKLDSAKALQVSTALGSATSAASAAGAVSSAAKQKEAANALMANKFFIFITWPLHS